MEKSDYQNVTECITQSIINMENAISWLSEEHKDREDLHTIIDEMTSFLKKYAAEIEKIA